MTTMLLTAAPTGYSALIAGDAATVEAAQRLRYRVFAEEMGAQLPDTGGLDVDEYDAYCDHLVVREDRTGEIVGTYRLLPPQRAIWLGRRYGDSEFDLTALTVLRDQLVEAGRSCVHPDHRTGAVINLMWAGIAKYLDRMGHRWLSGCASVPLADGGVQASQVWDLASRKHLSPPQLRVQPRNPWQPLPVERPATIAAAPPLLRGYLRLGAWVAGAPAHDASFGVADFYVLLGVDRIDPRYLKHFLAA
ncbi:GNAT family N-acetyltransferase [Catellatospora citrea]|nr:GNAT family N-acyltransferase [Catellatospora citrea]